MLEILFYILTFLCTIVFLAAIIITSWSFVQAVKFLIRGH